jgi:hypothetical protein
MATTHLRRELFADFGCSSGPKPEVCRTYCNSAVQSKVDDVDQIYGGLAAGDGLLVVPSGNNVTAYQLSTNP